MAEVLGKWCLNHDYTQSTGFGKTDAPAA